MEVGSKRGGKDERSLAVLFVFPALPFPTRFEPILCLSLPPPPQKLQNKRGWSNNNNTGLVIFERGEGEASFSQGPLLQLFVMVRRRFSKFTQSQVRPMASASRSPVKTTTLSSVP